MDMDKNDHLPLENLDLNSNTEKIEECFLYDLIQIALKSGRMIFLGISYTLSPSEVCCSDFVVKNHDRFKVHTNINFYNSYTYTYVIILLNVFCKPFQQFFLRILHMVFFCFLLIPFITEQFSLSDCSLVNFIKRGLHVVLLCSLVVGYRCLEINGRKMEGGLTGIFRQCFVLQNKFNALGLHFPPRAKVRISTQFSFRFWKYSTKMKIKFRFEYLDGSQFSAYC